MSNNDDGLPTLLTAIASRLGQGWRYQRGRRGAYLLVGPDGMRAVATVHWSRSHRDTMWLTGDVIDELAEFVIDQDLGKIVVSRSRPTADIVTDIRDNLLPTCQPIVAKAWEHKREADARRAAAERIARQIASTLHGGRVDGGTEVTFSDPSLPMRGAILVDQHGDTVTCEVVLRKDLAILLAEALTDIAAHAPTSPELDAQS